jgi:2-methylisocitrate lyase-like PEP mutase family enzyme
MKRMGGRMISDLRERRRSFKRLHESGCFVVPNPWSVGSARYLRHLGFKALATTSSGFAFSRGEPDADWAVSRDAMLAHVAEIVAATDLPVSADFRSGYAREPDQVAENVRMCVETGVSGLSIEDATGPGEASQALRGAVLASIYHLSLATRRVAAARAAIDAAGAEVLLTARAESYMVGVPNPLEDAVTRLTAYAEAGAHVVFAPGIRAPEDIRALVEAVAPTPVNVVMGVNIGLTVSDLAALGVRRVSVGSGLARAAWTGFARAAKLLADSGSVAPFDGNMTFAELDEHFRAARAPASQEDSPLDPAPKAM